MHIDYLLLLSALSTLDQGVQLLDQLAMVAHDGSVGRNVKTYFSYVHLVR
jgi:hypothetical protein